MSFFISGVQLLIIYLSEPKSTTEQILKRIGNPTLCDSRDGPGEHYAKSIKPAGERQIPYDFTDVESNEQNKLTK